MDRKPAVIGARSVTAADGSKGIVIDLQPENEAVMRWRIGEFNQADLDFAIEWRRSATGANLEGMKGALPKSPFKLRSAEEVARLVDVMLSDADLRGCLLVWFLGLLQCDEDTRNRVSMRWKWDVRRSLQFFAPPYAYHCLRVQLIFHTGMTHGVFGTRSSNIVDLEYLHYTPFAFVFCSGDKLHRRLASGEDS